MGTDVGYGSRRALCSTPHFSDHWLSLFPLTLSVPYENKKEKIFISFQG
jgi:hypothetical protein